MMPKFPAEPPKRPYGDYNTYANLLGQFRRFEDSASDAMPDCDILADLQALEESLTIRSAEEAQVALGLSDPLGFSRFGEHHPQQTKPEVAIDSLMTPSTMNQWLLKQLAEGTLDVSRPQVIDGLAMQLLSIEELLIDNQLMAKQVVQLLAENDQLKACLAKQKPTKTTNKTTSKLLHRLLG